MPVTDVIQATEAILTETRTRLTEWPGWGVDVFSGTSYDRLFEFIPELLTKYAGKPCVVVMYSGSDYQNFPRRSMRLAVLILVENPDSEEGQATVRELLDRCLSLLDEHISAHAKWEARTDSAVDFGPNVSCIKADFSVRDH